jgi:hypothetical protein
LASTKAGNGCAVITFTVSSVTYFDTFHFIGSNQTWTVPTGVTSIGIHLVGAGGGGASRVGGGAGGGGGYAQGSYSVTAGQQFSLIVGEGGGGALGIAVANRQPTQLAVVVLPFVFSAQRMT